MAFNSLHDAICAFEERRTLVRIRELVDPRCEITEIADRVVKAGGPALLFENVKGSDFPVAINLFGSEARMAQILGADSLAAAAREVEAFVKTTPPSSFLEKLQMLPKLAKFGSYMPRPTKHAPCQDVRMTPPDLTRLPILTCWPDDGGPFITFPMVITKDPVSGLRNVGIYRMQIYDRTTTGMHWQIHKVGARHYQYYKERRERMPVAVAIGGDPILTWTACAPLPDGVDELMIAGLLRRKPVDLVPCLTIPLEVPAECDFVIEGYVDPTEPLRDEGPFGDHTGYYTLQEPYPVFHVTAITHRRHPLYLTTIVGRPPMEDGWMGKAVERLSLPLLTMQLPELVDLNLPVEACFHNLAIVAIKKLYPGHAHKIMHTLWGTGQLMFSKTIIVVDHDVNPHNAAEVLWRVTNNIDPRRDVLFTDGPVDALDHAAPQALVGSKMGIDGTRKIPGEAHYRPWPPDIMMDVGTRHRIDALWDRLGLTPATAAHGAPR
ncbi:MAG: menaquinone biosynthesis decarboxylase [Deltaproteobacteria bacterium]|nr:menaquinone biosynthesis decarboxylase [Deltaproteobacteria bacterium]